MARKRWRTRTDSTAALARRDGWSNVPTMLATSRDKRIGASITATRLSWKSCEKLYRGDDMTAKIADEPAREMTRRWLDVRIEGDKEAAEAVEADLDELQAQDVFREAIAKSRVYGGAGVVELIRFRGARAALSANPSPTARRTPQKGINSTCASDTSTGSTSIPGSSGKGTAAMRATRREAPRPDAIR
jgi:hypothetical protein